MRFSPRTWLSASLFALALAFAPSARAQMRVIDPANLAQNIT